MIHIGKVLNSWFSSAESRHFSPFSIMENREELPRVSIGSVQHWQKVRSNYKEVALSRLREMLSSRRLTQEQDAILTQERDAILVHLEQVGQI